MTYMAVILAGGTRIYPKGLWRVVGDYMTPKGQWRTRTKNDLIRQNYNKDIGTLWLKFITWDLTYVFVRCIMGVSIMINHIISAFTDKFASTPFWWNRINAIFWRLRGCNHDGDFYLDLGDEDHSVMYCFRCNRRV